MARAVTSTDRAIIRLLQQNARVSYAELSRATGIPASCLIRYVLVKYAASGADALLTMTPIVLQQMEQHIQQAEAADSDQARLNAYNALRQMVTWLKLGLASE